MIAPADRSEPSAARIPVPVWLFVAMALLGYWSFAYLETHGGGFDPQVYQPYATLAFVKELHPGITGNPQVVEGEKIFNKICIVCHQSTGLGVPGQFPPLAGSEWVQAEGPNRIIRAVLNGLSGPIEVAGKQFDGAMPQWGTTLTKDEEVAAVLTFVRGNKDWGNNASPVTAKEVKAIRDAVKNRPTPWTAEELKAIPVKD